MTITTYASIDDCIFIDADEDQFIAELKRWVYEDGKHPMACVVFIPSNETGEKLLGIQKYSSISEYLFLGETAYSNYQSALTKVGMLIDDMGFDDFKVDRSKYGGVMDLTSSANE